MDFSKFEKTRKQLQETICNTKKHKKYDDFFLMLTIKIHGKVGAKGLSSMLLLLEIN